MCISGSWYLVWLAFDIRLTCVKPRVRVQPVQCCEGRIAAGHVTHERLLLGVDPRVHLQAGESRLRD